MVDRHGIAFMIYYDKILQMFGAFLINRLLRIMIFFSDPIYGIKEETKFTKIKVYQMRQCKSSMHNVLLCWSV